MGWDQTTLAQVAYRVDTRPFPKGSATPDSIGGAEIRGCGMLYIEYIHLYHVTSLLMYVIGHKVRTTTHTFCLRELYAFLELSVTHF